MKDSFLGFVALGGTIKGALLTLNASDVPTDATGDPAYRVYGPDSTHAMTNGTGTLTTFRDTAAITGATNASPIAITSVGHGLSTGTQVTITGVGGNTAANTTATITVTGSNTFSLDGVAGSGSYTSGGVWHVSGFYLFSFSPTSGNGFDSGNNYVVLFTFVVSAVTKSAKMTFGVT